ncbi:MAG: proline--tRNA ligase [Myxococcota bacterium]|nr:proline--tRNA ligase [Myxococcota bacterium]MEC9441944.1 proline--tRNA ligase [Myxococcota bacterium]
MRLSTYFVPTRKEDPADAEVVSHKLLIRAGYIRMVARGIYSFLPLGWRVVRKIEQIVREEMDRAGAQEILMPGVQPAELWHESGRWEGYGAELLRFKDRKGSDFVLGPTHEEVVTDIVRGNISSYKQLPVNLYQIQSKFRDEPRPRFGLMRGREFIMKDAYSFDMDAEGAHKSYAIMKDAYTRIFNRFGFEFRAVEADTGNIGGSLSHEFQVLAETGEDLIATSGDYAANVEKAAVLIEDLDRPEGVEFGELTEVETPGMRTIEEVAGFLDVPQEKLVKTLIVVADGKPLAVCMRGDHELNLVKLKAYLNAHTSYACSDIELADEETTGKTTKAPVGFAGPVGLPDGVDVVMDLSVKPMVDFVVGANKKDKHFTNVNHGRDFQPIGVTDLRQAKDGDICPVTGEPYVFMRGIEVGHIFYLGRKYSSSMGAALQGTDGELHELEMGCYGIGITRIMAAAVEQNHDDNGIIWPIPIAPAQVIVLPLQLKDEAVVEVAENLYKELREAGVEVIIDDRDIRPGGKFKDADLIGIPLRVTIGSRGLKNGEVEFKARDGEVEMVATGDIKAKLIGLIEDAGVKL